MSRYASSSSSQRTTGEKRFQYIPMRLDEEERRYLSILENALDVCEYTDVVDVTFSHLRTSKHSRMLSSLVDLLAINCGLIMSNDLGKGESLLIGKNLDENVPLFSRIFEIGRRYKIMNPSKMRDTYGKLMYVCMDTQQNLDLKLNFCNDIKTVYRYLRGTGCEGLMEDPLLSIATEVLDDPYPADPDFAVSSVAEKVPTTASESKRSDEMDLGEGKYSSGDSKHTDTDPDAIDLENEMIDDCFRDAGGSSSGSDADSDAAAGMDISGHKGGKGASSEVTMAERRSRKAYAHKQLVQKYSQMAAKAAADGTPSSGKKGGKETGVFGASDIELVIASVADNEAFLAFNVGPVEKMIELLGENFNPNKIEGPFSLELKGTPRKPSYGSSFSYGFSGFSSSYKGKGACLSHDHRTQFAFVSQSLMLWKEIMSLMPRLWLAADHDMLNNYYRLADTGQGYQRLQSCPKVSDLMGGILSHVKAKAGAPWVGLSVVHLGDRDVPNALVFIDKYTQVPRILTPIAQCVHRLPAVLSQDDAFHHYVKQEWGSVQGLTLQILNDFFKHGFDGSGDDGGSCIDGRLTSTWNWCSKLHKKPYYHVFMFTGFQGFDGDWKQD